jgi:thiopurine S-methyltransferase
LILGYDMEHDFWHEKWQLNHLGFHEDNGNDLLRAHINALALENNARIFVPLCGKTLDIAWLLQEGYHVIGVELSAIAIEELFDHLNLTPNITEITDFQHYSNDKIDIFVGDFFALTADMIGHIDAIYDRAALVALPHEMRLDYTQHLMKITNQAQQLLINFEYDQSLLQGPPFSITAQMIQDYYGANYHIRLLKQRSVIGGLKKKAPAEEAIWHCIPH